MSSSSVEDLNIIHNCCMCDAHFDNLTTLTEHFKTHNLDTDINPNFLSPSLERLDGSSSSSTSSSSGIQTHYSDLDIGIDEDAKPFCKVCKSSFPVLGIARRHLKNVHSLSKSEKIKLRQNYIGIHTDGNFGCLFCKSQFTTIQLIKSHIQKIHVKSKCKICRRENYAKDCRCLLCDNKCFPADNLDQHVQNKHPQMKKCHKCHNYIVTKKLLKEKRTTECELCSKSCTDLDSHMIQHHNNFGFQCEICHQAFKQTCLLVQHMEDLHPEAEPLDISAIMLKSLEFNSKGEEGEISNDFKLEGEVEKMDFELTPDLYLNTDDFEDQSQLEVTPDIYLNEDEEILPSLISSNSKDSNEIDLTKNLPPNFMAKKLIPVNSEQIPNLSKSSLIPVPHRLIKNLKAHPGQKVSVIKVSSDQLKNLTGPKGFTHSIIKNGISSVPIIPELLKETLKLKAVINQQELELNRPPPKPNKNGKLPKNRQHQKFRQVNGSLGKQCPICFFFLGRNMSMEKHLETAHTHNEPNTHNGLFQCLKCGLSFGTSDQLNRHNELAHKSKNFQQCTICNIFVDNLSDHIMSHVIKNPSSSTSSDIPSFKSKRERKTKKIF